MRLLLAILVCMLAGCSQSLTGIYDSGPSKNPHVLKLHGDGRYELGHQFTNIEAEHGRWWVIKDSIAVLLPDDTNEREHYVRVYRKGIITMRLSDDLRNLVDAP